MADVTPTGVPIRSFAFGSARYALAVIYAWAALFPGIVATGLLWQVSEVLSVAVMVVAVAVAIWWGRVPLRQRLDVHPDRLEVVGDGRPKPVAFTDITRWDYRTSLVMWPLRSLVIETDGRELRVCCCGNAGGEDDRALLERMIRSGVSAGGIGRPYQPPTADRA